MVDSCAIELRVQLPRPVAAEVERVQRQRPEVMSQIVQYGVMRRMIFDYLAAREEPGLAAPARAP